MNELGQVAQVDIKWLVEKSFSFMLVQPNTWYEVKWCEVFRVKDVQLLISLLEDAIECCWCIGRMSRISRGSEGHVHRCDFELQTL